MSWGVIRKLQKTVRTLRSDYIVIRIKNAQDKKTQVSKIKKEHPDQDLLIIVIDEEVWA